MWEHAEWLDTFKLEQILQGVIEKSYVSRTDLQGKSKKDQTKLLLSFKETFVTIVDQDRRFEKLIDRQRIADEVTNNIILD